MRSVWQVLYSKDKGLGKTSVSCLVLICISLDLLQDLPVGINGRDLFFYFFNRELTFIFEHIDLPLTGLRINDLYALTFMQEYAIHTYPGFQRHDIIIDQIPIPYSLFISVLEHNIPEICRCMSCRCSCKPYFDSIEMIKGLSPCRDLLCRITSMAFISDYEIKGMNGNIELGCIFFLSLFTA